MALNASPRPACAGVNESNRLINTYRTQPSGYTGYVPGFPRFYRPSSPITIAALVLCSPFLLGSLLRRWAGYADSKHCWRYRSQHLLEKIGSFANGAVSIDSIGQGTSDATSATSPAHADNTPKTAETILCIIGLSLQSFLLQSSY